MKKISLLLLCLALLLCLTACGSNEEPKADPTQPAAPEATAVTTAVPTAEITATEIPSEAPAATAEITEEPAATEAPALPATFPIGDTGLTMTLPVGWTLMSPADDTTLGMYGDETFSTLLQLNRMPVGISILREQTASIVAAGDGKDLMDTTLAGRTAYLYAAPDDSMRHAYIALGDNETLGLLFIVTDPSLFGAEQLTQITQSIQ